MPTAARPETLEITLRAIERQTARGSIARVVVSENLGDLRSRDVCAQFPRLPIDYRFREPCFGSMMEHAQQLFLEAEAEYVAFVCDDDVWMPGHLATGLEALQANPGASAFFSAFFAAESELSQSMTAWAPSLLWLVAGRPPRFSSYTLDLEAVLSLSWVLTPFQWSTLVARTQAATAAAPSLTSAPHFFYGDRLLIMALAEQGEIVFDPAVDTLYRVYQGNWSQTQAPEDLERLLDECQGIVEQKMEAIGVEPLDAWGRYLAGAPANLLMQAGEVFQARFGAAGVASFGLPLLLPEDAERAHWFTRALRRLRRAGKTLTGGA